MSDKVLEVLTEKAKTIMNKVREEINKDALLKKLDEMYDVEEQLMFNEFNIKQKTEQNGYYQKQFKLLHLTELSRLERLKERLEKETGKLYQALKNGEVSLTKAEIEKYYLPTNEDIIKIKGAIAKQETIVKFFELILKAFESQQWNMKTWQDLSKGGW
jgi:hypothetical protein